MWELKTTGLLVSYNEQEKCNLTSALQMAHMVWEGKTTSVALVKAAFDRIAETDDHLSAWVWLDRDYALVTAKNMDQLCNSGCVLSQMHGWPGQSARCGRNCCRVS